MSRGKLRRDEIPPCLWPFHSVAVDEAGDVHLCPCVQWTSMKPIGNVRDAPLEEIWNSERAITYREGFHDGRYAQLCKTEVCPYLRDPERVAPEARYVKPENAEAIRRGEGRMPEVFSRAKLDTERSCNLACTMCRSELVPRPENDTTARTLERLEPLWPELMEISPATAGEPLFIREIRSLLRSETLSENGVAVELVTNATLLSQGEWEEISHNRFCWVKVSADSVDPMRFEAIRRHGRFERLMEGIERLADLRRHGEIGGLQLATVVMRSNFRELPDFVRFAKAHAFDRLKLLALNDDLVPHEQLRAEDRQELARIVADPLFDDPVVELWSIEHLVEPERTRLREKERRAAPPWLGASPPR